MIVLYLDLISCIGHPKGGAAAWMLIGITQSINTGIIPGNRNAE
jgi:fatty acid synthase subunit alpha